MTKDVIASQPKLTMLISLQLTLIYTFYAFDFVDQVILSTKMNQTTVS